MQFGIFSIVQWHESHTQEQALREALGKIELEMFATQVMTHSRETPVGAAR